MTLLLLPVALQNAAIWSAANPPNATTNITTEPNLPAAVAAHPATANGADDPSGGDMVTTVGRSDSVEYDNFTLLSLLLVPQPVAMEAPSLSLNLLDGKSNTSNTMIVDEITRIVNHAANTTDQVKTTMDTTINTGATTNPLLPESDTLQKVNIIISTTKICPSNTNTQTVSTK
jgi:hypothetical protein